MSDGEQLTVMSRFLSCTKGLCGVVSFRDLLLHVHVCMCVVFEARVMP